MHPSQWKMNELPEPFQELIKQREELWHRRKELIEQLYEIIAELEGRPVRRLDIGFPFNLIVRFVSKALDTIEALVSRILAPFMSRQ